MKHQRGIDIEAFHAALSPAELKELRRKIQEGIDDLEGGRYTVVEGREGLKKFFSEIKPRGRARLRQTSK